MVLEKGCGMSTAESFREFVNPYTFVPLSADGQGVKRRAPSRRGADSTARFQGWVDVEWKTKTPMLLPRDPRKSGIAVSNGQGLDVVRVPGASVKGAMRSVHEALFNGCLSVIDKDFRPAYRDALAGGILDGWRLALVIESQAGIPTRVLLCEDETVWVESTSLKGAYSEEELPSSGDLVTIHGDRIAGTVGRWEIGHVRSVEVDHLAYGSSRSDEPPPAMPVQWFRDHAPGKSALLVTDTAARKLTRRGPGRELGRARALWATSIVTVEECTVAPSAVEEFRYACAGSRDLQLARSSGKKRASSADGAQPATLEDFRQRNCFEPVVWWPSLTQEPRGPKIPVGRRMKATGFLHPGAVVWVKTEGSTQKSMVTAIKLSVAWRTTAETGTEARIPISHRSCCQPEELCLSCATFGMAISRQVDDEAVGRHDARAGRVRFGDSITEPVKLTDFMLVPMGTPSAGAAGMYLQRRNLPRDRPGGDKPAQWGSAVDESSLREIRGRKFYWHADPGGPNSGEGGQSDYWSGQLDRTVGPRYEARTHHTTRPGEHTGEKRFLVPRHTKLKQRIAFDGLERTELIGLLAAIDPTALLRVYGLSWGVAHHLGGGKPLGLGTVEVCVTGGKIWRDADRYLGIEPFQPDSFTVDNEARAALEERCGDVQRNVRYTGVVLNPTALGDDVNLVSYPPRGPWSGFGTEEFDQSYAFFTQYSGERLRREDRPYYPLPAIDPRPGRQRLPNAERGRR